MLGDLRRAWRILVLAMLAGALATPAGAQGELSRITGVVKDDTGSPIPGAVVTARNPDAVPSSFTTTTDSKGRFAILGLRRGVWTFAAQAAGYEPDEITGPVQPRRPLPELEFSLRKTPAPGPRGALAGVDVDKLQRDLQEAESRAAAGRDDDALAIYERALTQVPALTALNLEIGALYTRKHQPEKALTAYQKRLDAEPTDDKARASVGALAFELAMAALERNDTAAATKYLEQSLAADPTGSHAADARAALDRLRRR